jgi:hypothetical protein
MKLCSSELVYIHRMKLGPVRFSMSTDELQQKIIRVSVLWTDRGSFSI